jgi:two-component system, sensor histidine kinase LadS
MRVSFNYLRGATMRIVPPIWVVGAVAFGLASFCACAQNAGPVVLSAGVDTVQVGPHVEYFVDATGELSIDEISSTEYAGRFIANTGNDLHFGFATGTYWIRLRIEHRDHVASSWVLELNNPRLYGVDVFVPQNEVGFDVLHSGLVAPIYEQPIRFYMPSFPIKTVAGESTVYYARVDAAGSVRFLPTLRTQEVYGNYRAASYWAMGLYFGALCVLLVHEILVLLAVRNAARLYYVFYVASTTLYLAALSGIANQVLWPGYAWWSDRSVVFLFGISFVFSMSFARRFLNTRLYAPRFDLALNITRGAALLVALGTFLESVLVVQAATLLAPVAMIVMIGATVVCYKRGHRGALYLLLGWAAFFVGGALLTLSGPGLIPMNFLTENGIGIGFLVSLLMFSQALINEAKSRSRAHRKELENEVGMRTAELINRTEELQEAFENIKTLKGLIPICSACKSVRDDEGFWNQVETYIRDRTDAEFTHGICPQCIEKLYPDLYRSRSDEGV